MAPRTRSNPSKKSEKFEETSGTDLEEDKKSSKSKTVKKAVSKTKLSAQKNKNKIKSSEIILSENDLSNLAKEVVDAATSSKIVETTEVDQPRKKSKKDVTLKKQQENINNEETSFSKDELCNLLTEEDDTINEDLKIKTISKANPKAKSKKETSKKKQSDVHFKSKLNKNKPKSQKLSKNKKKLLSAENENVDPASVKPSKIPRKRKNTGSASTKKQNVTKSTKRKKITEDPNTKLIEPPEINDMSQESIDKQQILEQQHSSSTELCSPEKENFASTSQCSPNNIDETCTKCEQNLNQCLRLYSGEPKDGFCEDIAITDKCLSLFEDSEEEMEESIEDNRAYNKITFFE